MTICRQHCSELDQRDPLKSCRDRFDIPPGRIYLDGNSLGAMPLQAPAKLQQVIRDQWGRDLIQSWNKAGWFDLPVSLGNRLGKLVGAADGQIVVCDNTSINLFKALQAALAINVDRDRIIADRDDFPTDLYIIEGAARSCGRAVTIELVDDPQQVAAQFDEQCAVVVLSEINYRSGLRLDMAAITAAAHDKGILVIWDLCHSAGAVPVTLDLSNADFAVGCSYKYLNGGPGAPAYIYAASRHHKSLSQPLQGWWSHRNPFEFTHQYQPADGIKRLLSGTQPILSMCAVEYGLDTFDGVDMDALQTKSQQLCQLFVDLVQQQCGEFGVSLLGPQDVRQRGSHVALAFEHGYSVVRAMSAAGVTGDFRAPDVMRFGFAPLYVSFEQVFDAVEIMRQCIEKQVWQDNRYTRVSAVT